MQLCTAVCEKIIRQKFKKLGRFIATYPRKILVFVAIFSTLCLIGLINFDQINDAKTQLSPTNARSQIEFKKIERFLQQNGTMNIGHIILQAADNRSLFRNREMDQLYWLTREVLENTSVTVGNRSYKFEDICAPYCQVNEPFMTFLRVYNSPQILFIKLQYPSFYYFGHDFYIGDNVFGVRVENATGGKIADFKTAVIDLYLVVNKSQEHVAIAFENEVKRLLVSNKYDALSGGMTTDNMISEEVQRMGDENAPLIGFSIVSLMVFVVVCSIRHELKDSFPFTAMVGVCIPVLANAVAIGFLSIFSLKFQSIVVVTLFLVLGVGVDNMFIITRAWDQRKSTQSKLSERLAATLEESGPSITVTSLTNALSFSVGILTSKIPMVQTFSIYSSVAIIFCYFLQLFTFCSVLVISAERELSGVRKFCCISLPENVKVKLVGKLGDLHSKAIDVYSKIAAKIWFKTMVFVILIAYWSMAANGYHRLDVEMELQDLALPGSYVAKYKALHEETIESMQALVILVERPPDMTKPDQLKRVRNLVRDFENSTFGFGPESTRFWLHDYTHLLTFFDEFNKTFTYRKLPIFLEVATYSPWSNFLRLNETACEQNLPSCVRDFIFVIGFHNVIRFNDLIAPVREWREIAQKYSDMEVYSFTDRIVYADQAVSLPKVIYITAFVALICMGIICMIFIPNLASITFAMLSVLSINFGVFGFLSLWGIMINPLSMAALLMSIGFSVDFTAHISYHLYAHQAGNSILRLKKALNAIGWPMLQSGLTNLLAVWALLLKDTYLGEIFLKTIFLIVIFGLFHGLVVLPAAFTWPPKYSKVDIIRHN